MKVIVVNNIAKAEMAPSGAILFWSKNASEVPQGWTLYDTAADAFIMGVDTAGINLTKTGALSHAHTVKNTGSYSHTHTISVTGIDPSQSLYTERLTGDSGSGVIANHNHSKPTINSVNSNSHTHTIDNTDSSSYIPPYVRYYLIKSSDDVQIPIGAIALWPNNKEQIPSAWRICDGSTYDGKTLPNIIGRFIYVPSDDAGLGSSGGNSSHNHSVTTTESRGNHRHGVYLNNTSSPTSGTTYLAVPGTAQRVAGAAHVHIGKTLYTSYAGSHSHTISNGLIAVDILPPYMKLYFIVKVQ